MGRKGGHVHFRVNIRLAVAGLSIVFAFAFAGGAIAHPSAGGAQSSLRSFRLALGFPGYPQTVWAASKHTWQRHGLQPTVGFFSVGRLALDAVIRGDYDVGTVAPGPIVLAVAHGVPVTILARITLSHGYLTVRTDSGITSPSQLRGKKIGVVQGTVSTTFLDRLLKSVGFKPTDVTQVNIDPTQMAAALAHKSVDAVSVWQPVTLQSEETLGNGNFKTFEYPYSNGNYIVALTSWAHDHADIVARIVKSLQQAETQLKKKPALAQAKYTKAGGFAPDIGKASFLSYAPGTIYPVCAESTIMGELEDNLTALVAAGALSSIPTSADLRDTFYPMPRGMKCPKTK